MAAEHRTRSEFDLSNAFGRSDVETAPSNLRRTAAALAPVLLLVAFAQLLDLVTFAFAVERWGIQGELGPLGLVYEMAGYWAVAAVKAATIALVMLAMVAYGWKSAVTPWRIGLFTAGIGAFGAATNVAALL